MGGQPPVPIVGQPFAVQQVGVCVNVILTCHCTLPGATITIVSSAPAACPLCGKVYNAALNPANNQLQIAVAAAADEGVKPS